MRASHTHVDPEKMSWSQSGLEEAREEGTWECIPAAGQGGGPQKGAKSEVTRWGQRNAHKIFK